MNKCQVVIVGAGPYGLSVGAYLNAAGVDFRIFGKPMHTWITQMPQGMRLKSEGFASSLYDPGSTFTLGHYCKEHGLPYADTALPVPIDTFINYGLEFQSRFVPHLEDKTVVSIKRQGTSFRVLLDDSELIETKAVVIAAGISHFGYVPPELATLSRQFVTHSSEHCALQVFRGRSVAIVGAGASAIDLAALLHEAGAKVEVIARQSVVRFHDPPNPKPRTWVQRLRNPRTGIGGGWMLYFCAYMPWAFRLLPESIRLKAVRKILGPAPGWFVKDQVVGKVRLRLGAQIESAKVQDGRVSLSLKTESGTRESVNVDHVIAATGYKVDLTRLTFLDRELTSEIQLVENSPRLSSTFESSVPGLYFVGVAAANTFGPLLRFAYGAGFAARRVASPLSRPRFRKTISKTHLQNTPTEEREEVELHG